MWANCGEEVDMGWCLGLSEGSEVGEVVVDVLDGDAEDLDANAANVGGGDIADQGGELVCLCCCVFCFHPKNIFGSSSLLLVGNSAGHTRMTRFLPNGDGSRTTRKIRC